MSAWVNHLFVDLGWVGTHKIGIGEHGMEFGGAESTSFLDHYDNLFGSESSSTTCDNLSGVHKS